jgi:hypothetical protein
MSVRSARLGAVLFVLLAFACGLAEQQWLQPLKWRAGTTSAAFDLGLCSAALSFAVPIAGFLMTTVGARRGATWEVDPGGPRFVAPPAVRRLGALAVILGGLAAGLVPLEPIPFDPVDFRTRTAQFGIGPVNSVVLAAVVLAVAVAVALSMRPSLALTRAGLTLRRAWSPVTIGWDELLPGGPPRPRQNASVVRLYQAGAIPVEHRLPAGSLNVDPGFLAYTIWLYAHHPDRRAQIGEQAELAALQSSFAVAVAPLATRSSVPG